MHPFDRAAVWLVCKVYIAAADAVLSTAEPLTSPTKLSVTLIDLSANYVNALTTALATKLDRKHRRAEATSAAHAEIVSGLDQETETEKEDNNYTGTASIRD